MSFTWHHGLHKKTAVKAHLSFTTVLEKYPGADFATSGVAARLAWVGRALHQPLKMTQANAINWSLCRNAAPRYGSLVSCSLYRL